MKKLIDETDFGIQEGFVYNFVNKIWYKYSKPENKANETAASWSDVLHLDLNSLL